MDHVEDVERLFSWLKAPMVHYREFAPQREIAEAVATWPVAHRAAVQAGVAAEAGPAPQGDAAAKERIARDSRTLPLAPLVQHTAAPETPASAPISAEPAAVEDRPAGSLGERLRAARAEPSERVAVASEDQADEPIIAGFEEPPAPVGETSADAGLTPRRASEDREPAAYYPGRDRGALFAGEYRGRDRDARPRERVADRQDRSLDAVFSRMSGSRDRLPDPRTRARTNPGLGGVFGRLR